MSVAMDPAGDRECTGTNANPGSMTTSSRIHLSQPTAEYEAARPAIDAVYSKLWALPDWPSFREAAGDADAAIPPGGPDRYRDVVTEFLHFPARDGQLIELKVYKSPNAKPNATLMYRLHGGGKLRVSTIVRRSLRRSPI